MFGRATIDYCKSHARPLPAVGNSADRQSWAARAEYLQLDGEDHEYRRPIRGKILISRMVSFLTGALKVS